MCIFRHLILHILAVSNHQCQIAPRLHGVPRAAHLRLLERQPVLRPREGEQLRRGGAVAQRVPEERLLRRLRPLPGGEVRERLARHY